MAQERNWTQTSPKTWERAIDDFEGFYAFIGATAQGRPEKQNWYTAAGVRLDTQRQNLVEDVKQGWIALRYEHPVLSAVIEDGHWIYRTADEHELSTWLAETLQVHDTTQTARQLFPYSTNPGQRAVLHVFPNTKELVLSSPHTHIDAFGIATFFDNLLRLLVAPAQFNPRFGDEAENLIPPLSVLTNVPRDCPLETQSRFNDLLTNWVSSMPTVRVQTENPTATAGNTKLAWLTFDVAETSALVSKTKELGLSVTGVAQAAMSRAAKIHGQVSNTTHATFGLYNGREYISDSEVAQSQLVGPHVFALPLVFPIDSPNFIETARAARNVFTDAKAGGLHKDASGLWSSVMPQVLSAAPPPDMPVPADVILSSVGVIDKYLGQQYTGARPAAKVDDFWIALEVFAPNFGVEMWTRQGELTTIIIYNAAFHRGDSVVRFVELVT